MRSTSSVSVGVDVVVQLVLVWTDHLMQHKALKQVLNDFDPDSLFSLCSVRSRDKNDNNSCEKTLVQSASIQGHNHCQTTLRITNVSYA